MLWHWFDSIGYPPRVPARGGFEGDALVLSAPRTARDEPHDVPLTGERLTQEFDGAGGGSSAERGGPFTARLALTRL